MQDMMPIQLGKLQHLFPLCPKAIPMALLDEATALRNNNQTLECLAQRGGISPSEAVALIEKRRWCEMDVDEATQYLTQRVADYLRTRKNAEVAEKMKIVEPMRKALYFTYRDLIEYGRHHGGCLRSEVHACTCGLADALTRAELTMARGVYPEDRTEG